MCAFSYIVTFQTNTESAKLNRKKNKLAANSTHFQVNPSENKLRQTKFTNSNDSIPVSSCEKDDYSVPISASKKDD